MSLIPFQDPLAFRVEEYPKWSDQSACFTPSEREARTFRLECLKMATLHANAELVETGAVYKIAEDYYDYIINGNETKAI